VGGLGGGGKEGRNRKWDNIRSFPKFVGGTSMLSDSDSRGRELLPQ